MAEAESASVCCEEDPPEAKRICLQGDRETEEPKDKKGGSLSKRRKAILLLSYNGKGYMGMQKNPGVQTIEEDLLEALSKAGAFPAEMKANLGQLKFQRCARTDKGVSAARQVVSLKMVFDQNLVPLVNTHLPAQIRVFALMKVTRSFDSRHNCSGRSYEYLLPTYAFAPYRLTTLDYRIDDATIALVNKLLQYYVGTHNFHNFTSGKKFEEASSNRYIVSFESGERLLAKSTGKGDKEGKEVELLPLRVRGQSFVIHQIRKMIGLMIAVVRGHTPEATVVHAYHKEKVDIPRAPALGLLLNSVHFDGYNQRFASDGSREPLEWSRFEDEIEQFKKEHIYQTIVDTEVNDLSLMQWLNSLKIHDFRSTAHRLLKQAEAKAKMNATHLQAVPSKSEIDTSELKPTTDDGVKLSSEMDENVQSAETGCNNDSTVPDQDESSPTVDSSHETKVTMQDTTQTLTESSSLDT